MKLELHFQRGVFHPLSQPGGRYCHWAADDWDPEEGDPELVFLGSPMEWDTHPQSAKNGRGKNAHS